MFALPPEGLPDAGAGNWSIALVLLCLIDGLSMYVHPIYPRGKRHHRKRFEMFLANKLLTGPQEPRERAAATIYNEFRGLLVHELSVDKHEAIRNGSQAEPAVAKWTPIPEQEQDVGQIEQRIKTDYAWPVFSVQPYNGRQRHVLCCAALYGSLKAVLNELANDQAVLKAAAVAYPNLVVMARAD